jgi:hypothetical protein
VLLTSCVILDKLLYLSASVLLTKRGDGRSIWNSDKF